MKFGEFKVEHAAGAILAHAVKHADGVFKKGRILSVEDAKILRAQSIFTVTAAMLDADDVPEDIAAHRVALSASGNNAKPQQAFTGRANLHSAVHGVAVFDELRIRALNHLHESLTLATLANYTAVQPKQMLATVKVIPFAVPKAVLEQAIEIIGGTPLVRVEAFTPKNAGLVITQLPHTKPQLIAKSESAMRDRLSALGANLSHVITTAHDQQNVAEAITTLKSKACDPILVFGASAIIDRADVIPAALVQAGGNVVHLGMPVDPGNLLMLGALHQTSVIGVPSCARSPKVNGFDWVLERLCANIPVTASDVMDMGAGGLLAEIQSRPTPREPKSLLAAPRVAAIVLAAGLSSRMAGNKMLAEFHGQPLLRATVVNTLAAVVDEVIVVTGHRCAEVEQALAGLPVRIVHNPDYAQGLSTSLRQGIAATTADAAVVCLGDMPLVSSTIIDRLIAAFNPTEHRSIIVPVHKGQFGNPVLWGSEHFAKLLSLEGDRGARTLVAQLKSDAIEIEAGSDAVLRDADTQEALAQLAQES